MRLIRNFHNLSKRFAGTAVTIGSFDGVHRGHQALIKQLTEKAGQLNVPSVLVSFEPKPREFFSPESAPARLSNLREKLLLLQDTGIDYFLLLKFNEQLASLTADEFIKSLLIDKLNAKHVILGQDFQFGKGREGNFNTLKMAGESLGFAVEAIETVTEKAERISSTAIRDSLSQADFATAKKLLSYDYFMAGRIAHGNKQGRTIGFPTINIAIKRIKPAVKGIFAVTVLGLKDKPIKGVASLGTRPIIKGEEYILEVHLFDFDEVVYGEYVKVIFHEKIRDEENYESFELLRQQIVKDANAAKQILRLK